MDWPAVDANVRDDERAQRTLTSAMQTPLRQALESALSGRESPRARRPVLVDDARRLWKRIEQLLDQGLIADAADRESLELACYALQLPLATTTGPSPGRTARTALRERAETAAELLISQFGEQIDAALLDRITRLLHELPQRPPVLDEAKLLADVVNLDDFGVSGLFLQAYALARSGEGLSLLIEGAAKREQYGYWQARLKDGFHFQAVHQIAQARLEAARKVAELLSDELIGDAPA